jgi:hypothetical protein
MERTRDSKKSVWACIILLPSPPLIPRFNSDTTCGIFITPAFALHCVWWTKGCINTRNADTRHFFSLNLTVSHPSVHGCTAVSLCTWYRSLLLVYLKRSSKLGFILWPLYHELGGKSAWITPRWKLALCRRQKRVKSAGTQGFDLHVPPRTEVWVGRKANVDGVANRHTCLCLESSAKPITLKTWRPVENNTALPRTDWVKLRNPSVSRNENGNGIHNSQNKM